MIRLSGLTVYPIKSAAGISVPAWEVDEFGLRHDRRWMVVDEQGGQLTQRAHPRLALVRPAIEGDRLRVTAPGQPPLVLPLVPAHTVALDAIVWRDVCAAHWMGEQAAGWFTRFLGVDCSLVYMPPETVRLAEPEYAPGARVSFADAFPFLLLSEESLGDLNGRLSEPVPMNRFRPNLVAAGGEPYHEDHLGRFRIGQVDFRAVKPCDRCVLITTDQETAQRGPEPPRTLAGYRMVGREVLFGQNLVHTSGGRLQVGDPLLS